MKKTKQNNIYKKITLMLAAVLALSFLSVVPASAITETPAGGTTGFTCPDGTVVSENAPCPSSLNCTNDATGKASCTPSKTNGTCGTVKTSLNYGCKGVGNGIMDLLLALLRFLSVGVGLILIGLTVFSGIQYSAAQGDPSMIAQAKNRLVSVFVALIIYLLSFALLNYLVPGGLLA